MERSVSNEFIYPDYGLNNYGLFPKIQTLYQLSPYQVKQLLKTTLTDETTRYSTWRLKGCNSLMKMA